MISVADLFLRIVCDALVALTAWETGRGWLRDHDRHRTDILWVIGLLVLILLFGDWARSFATEPSAVGFLFTLFFLSQPYFLLRLVGRFRPVPPFWPWMTAAIAVGGAGLGAMTRVAPPGGWQAVVAAYVVAELGYAAWAFGSESAHAGGAAGARLWWISLGTWFHVAIAIVIGAEAVSPAVANLGAELRRLLGAGVFGCYYAGLVTPRQLRAIWTERELYQFVRRVADRHPDERAEQSAADLCRAVGQSVASEGRAVLFVSTDNAEVLSVRAASAADWMDRRVHVGSGLIGRALARGTPVEGAPADCEPEIAAMVAAFGRHVWVVPIVYAGRRSGVVLGVQRVGSLFPDDDLEFVSVLASHTAATLEHARLLAARDETERRALGERLQQAQKMEAVGQLAAGVAHDFNNLLTAVLGYATMIEAHPGYDRSFNEPLADIRRIAARATALTRRLLAFSRRQAVEPRTMNLPDVVVNLMPMIERILEGQVDLTFTADADDNWIRADPVQIEQVALNLIINARDAMSSGGRLEIRTGTKRLRLPTRVGDAALGPGDYATLTVTDTGVGIDTDTRARMFEPFFTTKEPGRGTGLGLSTVYGIVKQLDGSISVDSARGHGATFEILVPGVDPPPVGRSRAGAPPSADTTILVVDDDESP